MSPVFILSRLCLKRRFQFFGISVPPEVRYLRTFFTASSSITLRSPTRSAFSAGTLTVISLWSILIVRYSRVSPRTSFFSRFTTVPAPWCGYTTLSPILYKLSSLFRLFAEVPADAEGAPAWRFRVAETPGKRHFFAAQRKKSCSGGFCCQRGPQCLPERLRLDAGSARPGRGKHRRK